MSDREPATGTSGARDTSPQATASDTSALLLHARGLQCSVAGRTIWHDVNLTLHAGERWVIRGPSGSGKTLLLRALAHLTALESGQITTGPALPGLGDIPRYRASVLYLAQRPALPEGSVQAALQAPYRLQVRRGRQFPADKLHAHLATLQLAPTFLDQATRGLSGGESQIVALLRALLVEPTVLLLDEPTASLDAQRTEIVETLVAQWLAQDPTRAYLWTSHDERQQQRVGDHILSLPGSS